MRTISKKMAKEVTMEKYFELIERKERYEKKLSELRLEWSEKIAWLEEHTLDVILWKAEFTCNKEMLEGLELGMKDVRDNLPLETLKSWRKIYRAR
ncbi:hypothetical protein [Priestia megaterium]|uniref:hypothetical protein n=1 Tax=Priestia megaterium TaxID=1404 RepID=UPI000BEC03C9|nr:hypothetical protein [Priestia megaterium]PED64009.1 hypothetical protein CON20_23895 [Priestia megaterium]